MAIFGELFLFLVSYILISQHLFAHMVNKFAPKRLGYLLAASMDMISTQIV